MLGFISSIFIGCVGLLFVSTNSCVLAFSVLPSQQCTSREQLSCYAHSGDKSVESQFKRRAVLQNALSFAGIAASAVLLPLENANAGLLDDYGSSSTTISQPKTISAAEKANMEAIRQAASAKKEGADFEPNLRANYYYPTNKKRYLPRIKRCNDAIPDAAAMIGNSDWEGAETFAIKIADDTVLPMKLYTSSLLGGGTNVKVSFADAMKTSANDFEKAQKKLVKAIAKKDQKKSSEALEELSTALLTYRTAGKLLGPDGGGDIPSVDEIRRSACRVQGRSFEQKIKDRDERLKG